MVSKYKKFRIDAYMHLFESVAARDRSLRLSVRAFPADGCPNNVETYVETCRYACFPGASRRGLVPCQRAAGFMPFTKGAVQRSGRGYCCLREEEGRDVVTREVLPPQLPAPVLCFQKDAHNRAAILLPEIQMLYENYYADEKKTTDPVPWEKKDDSRPHFAGAATGPWIGALNQRIRVCRGLGLNSSTLAEDRGSRRSVSRIVDQSARLGPVDCHLVASAALTKSCYKNADYPPSRGPFTNQPFSWTTSLRFKYLLSLDGNGATCARVFKILRSNSVLLKMEQKPPFSEKSELFYFAGLEAWRHYVPVTEDNLAETVRWLREHDDVARNISEQGKLFAKYAFQKEASLHYTHLLLSTLQALRRA